MKLSLSKTRLSASFNGLSNLSFQFFFQFKSIIMEISFKEIYENQAMPDELINYLKAYNFEIYARCNRTKFNGSDFQEDVLFKKK